MPSKKGANNLQGKFLPTTNLTNLDDKLSYILATNKPLSITFKATLHRFEENADKSGWTYFEIPAELAQQLKPGNKRSFRVKGRLDDHKIEGVTLLPAGDGNFMMPVNAPMRKGIKKRKGATIEVTLTVDEKPYQLNNDLLTCLQDDPGASEYFYSLTPGHRNYFSKWIDSAKTEPTKTKRLTQTIASLAKKMDYGQMIRFYKGKD